MDQIIIPLLGKSMVESLGGGELHKVSLMEVPVDCAIAVKGENQASESTELRDLPAGGVICIETLCLSVTSQLLLVSLTSPSQLFLSLETTP